MHCVDGQHWGLLGTSPAQACVDPWLDLNVVATDRSLLRTPRPLRLSSWTPEELSGMAPKINQAPECIYTIR